METTTTTIGDLLARAIRTRRVIEFTYHGVRRTVWPATLGVHVATGNPVLRGYPVTEAGAAPEGDLYLLFKVRDLTITSARYDAVPAGYRVEDPAMSTVLAGL